MINTNTGGPAFPSGLIDPSTPEDAVHPLYLGLSIRDYFAAKAMQGLIAGANPKHSINLHGAAEWAYNMADAMIAAREAE